MNAKSLFKAMTENKIEVGNLVRKSNYSRILNPIEGVVIRNKNILWGHNIEVQIVNGNIFYRRGDIVTFRESNLEVINKITI